MKYEMNGKKPDGTVERTHPVNPARVVESTQ